MSIEEIKNMDILTNKIQLIRNIEPTPMYKMKFNLNNKNLFIKREDLIDFGIGGNKVRLLEYIIYDAVQKGAKKLITFGSVHSNHVRITAAAAYLLNLKCDIIILKNDNEFESIEGNRLLLELYKSNVYYCELKNAKEYIDEYLNNQDELGEKYYFIPGGGHNVYGALGYVNCLLEIKEQCEKYKIHLNSIALPTGTGTCQAGLIFASKLLNWDIKIIGFSIARDRKRCNLEIKKILYELNEKFNTSFDFDDDSIIVMDKHLNKYGVMDKLELDTIQKLLKLDGVILDPIYNGKAFTALANMEVPDILGNNILYINTGGLPNIFTEGFKKEIAQYEYYYN